MFLELITFLETDKFLHNFSHLEIVNFLECRLFSVNFEAK